MVGTSAEDWEVDAEGNTVGWGPALDTRLRASMDLVGGDSVDHLLFDPLIDSLTDELRLGLELDVASGQLLGDPWDLPGDERGRDQLDALTLAGILPRRALVGAQLPIADVELGLTTSSWGLGMVANDGASDPLFGRTDFGDRVLRLRLATQPLARGGQRLPLIALAAFDRVVADDLARWDQGDRAYQGIVALLWADDREEEDDRVEVRRAGVYGVLRDQRDDEGRHTQAGVMDLYGETTVALSTARLSLGAESAALLGQTDAARTYVAPDGLAIRQLGLAVRTRLSDRRDTIALHLRGALASGDGDPDDGVVSDFRFDRDYDVGMVLFDELLSSIDAGAHRLASDPARAAVPPEGVDTLLAEGALHQAMALQPAVVGRPWPWLKLKGGLVLARATAPISHPYYAFRSGGVPTNQAGLPTSGRSLGTEIDWGLTVSSARAGAAAPRPEPSSPAPGAKPAPPRLVTELSLQGGHAWPSRWLSPLSRVDHLLLVGQLRW